MVKTFSSSTTLYESNEMEMERDRDIKGHCSRLPSISNITRFQFSCSQVYTLTSLNWNKNTIFLPLNIPVTGRKILPKSLYLRRFFENLGLSSTYPPLQKLYRRDYLLRNYNYPLHYKIEKQ